MYDTLLQGGVVVTEDRAEVMDIGVSGGRVAELLEPGSSTAARRLVDLSGKIVLPGLIDPHLHFGLGDVQGDDTMVEDFRISSQDCAVGGVTTLVSTTLIGGGSIVDLYERAQRCAAGRSWANYKFTCVVNNEAQVAEIQQVAKLGCSSFKFFTGYIGEQAASFGMSEEGITPDLFMRACEEIRKSGTGAFAKIHAEEPYVRGILVDQMRNSGREDLLVSWAESSPDWAESAQVYTYGHVANQVGVPIYPVHVSSGTTVGTIEQMLGEGTEIIGETLALYLCATAPELDHRHLGGLAKNQPPVRFEEDRKRLWEAIRSGVIKIVGTDSGTYSSNAKLAGDFWDCRVGINLQVADTLSLLYEHGVRAGEIDLIKLARCTSTEAAKLYGLYPRKGVIATGSDADLVVFDPERPTTLGTHRYRGSNDFSIWEGINVSGAPVQTWLSGELVMEDGEPVGTGGEGVAL